MSFKVESQKFCAFPDRVDPPEHDLDHLIDRLLEAQLIDVHLAAELLASPLKVMRLPLDISFDQ